MHANNVFRDKGENCPCYNFRYQWWGTGNCRERSGRILGAAKLKIYRVEGKLSEEGWKIFETSHQGWWRHKRFSFQFHFQCPSTGIFPASSHHRLHQNNIILDDSMQFRRRGLF